MEVVAYVRIAYCVPSSILYILVLIALFRELRGSSGLFYPLLIVQAILNVLVFVNSLYLIQLASFTTASSWFSGVYKYSPPFIVKFSNCIAINFAFVQTYMSFFVSLYRMTVIAFPLSHITVWKYAFPASVVITLCTPFIATYPMLARNSRFIIVPETGTYYATTDANMYIVLMQLYVFMSIFLVASSVVNIVSVTLLCIRSKRHSDKAERNMFILALLDFAVQVTFYILFAIIFERADVGGIADVLVPFASDLLTFSNAYLLIILNRRIRQRILPKFWRRASKASTKQLSSNVVTVVRRTV